MDPLIPSEATALVEQERTLLERLHGLLEVTGADEETRAALREVIDHLDGLFLVVIVGEFNAGKSSVVNALFGRRVMEEGPIPTTASITVLRHGEQATERRITDHLVERRLPAEFLRHLQLVDTPGTNSIIQEHQRLTEDFVPRADLVLFVTSYDRPLTESERRFLTFIREAWGKQLVFVLNKADLARDRAALAQVVEHIQSGCRELMGFEPELFAVSAELAQAAREQTSEAARARLWEASRFAPFEAFVTERLAGPERLRLKLEAPLGTAGRLLDGLTERLARRRDVLARDEEHLDAFDADVEAARATLADSYGRAVAEVEGLLHEMERRGVQFLDDTIRASYPKIQLLRDRDAFRRAFEREVVRDVDRQIETRVTDAVDALLAEAARLQHRALQTLAERVRAQERRLGEAHFSYNRAAVFGEVMREAERRIELHDVRAEAQRILENARGATDMVLGAGAGAAGLGVLGVALLAAPTLDALGGFGLATAAVLVAGGATVLPRQRRKAVREFRARCADLREALREALTGQFGREVDAALDRLQETVAPYSTFVRDERATLDRAAEEQQALAADLEALRRRVRQTVDEATA